MGPPPFWRKIYQTLTGFTSNVGRDVVSEVLEATKEDLIKGLSIYEPYTDQSFEQWSKETDVDGDMKVFVKELSVLLDVIAEMGYMIMCNFLMFEYYGKVKEFWQIAQIGNSDEIKEQIYDYYITERMFYLKSIRHIFEKVPQSKYKFCKEYKHFVRSLNMNTLQNHMIKQLETLVQNVGLRKFAGQFVEPRKWICMNNREQLEILMILMLTTQYSQFDTIQINRTVILFVENYFSNIPAFYESTQYSGNGDSDELLAAHVASVIVLFEKLFVDAEMTAFWAHEATKKLDTAIKDLRTHPSRNIIVLIWLVLKFKSKVADGQDELIMEVLLERPFTFLYTVVSNKIFKYCQAGKVVRKAVHKMMDVLCLVVEDRRELFHQTSFVTLIGELITDSDLAKISLEARNGLDAVIEIVLGVFPLDFYSITTIGRALLKGNYWAKALDMLNNLPSFLSDETWNRPSDNVYVLPESQRAFDDSDLIMFSQNTVVRSFAIFGKNYLQYGENVRYFTYLEYLIGSVKEDAYQYRAFDPELLSKLIAGGYLLIEAIKHSSDAVSLADMQIETCVEAYDEIVTDFEGSMVGPEYLGMYLEMQAALVNAKQMDFLSFAPAVLWEKIFPRLEAHFFVKHYDLWVFDENMFGGSILTQLFEEERRSSKYSLLLTYLDFFYTILSVKYIYHDFQLSSLFYFLHVTFGNHLTWEYEDDYDKLRISVGCLKIFHHVLQKRPGSLKEPGAKVYYLCEYCFLHSPTVIEAFLSLFADEKECLMYTMERESDWIKGPATDKLKCLELQLGVLLIVINLSSACSIPCSIDNKFERLVKPVASCFTNSYSPDLIGLSCRLLATFSQDSGVPLLSLLEMDNYQVQSLFLERLRDPLEEAHIKLCVLELIDTAIFNQDALTTAFFNMKCSIVWNKSSLDDSVGIEPDDTITDFMIDYLTNIKETHEYLDDPIQLAILQILSHLWVRHREFLISNVTNSNEFWQVMIDPFCCELNQKYEIYSAILGIFNAELETVITGGATLDSKLMAAIDKFIQNGPQLKSWADLILRFVNDSSTEKIKLLNGWVEFVMFTKILSPGTFVKEAQLQISRGALEGMGFAWSVPTDAVVLYLWAQLYLHAIISWGVYDNFEEDTFHNVGIFLRTVIAQYKSVNPKLKEVALCIVEKTLSNLSAYANKEENVFALMCFVDPAGILIDFEYDTLESVWGLHSDTDKIKRLRCWMIAVMIGDALLPLNEIAEHLSVWFHYRKFLVRVLDTAAFMMESEATLPLAKLAMAHVVRYSESAFNKDFYDADLKNFYYRVQPPSINITVEKALNTGLSTILKEWWQVYTLLIRLNCRLMENLDSKIHPDCLYFMSQNDKVLTEIILLTLSTVDLTALNVVAEALRFVILMQPPKLKWYIYYPGSYEFVVDGIKSAFNACTLTILGSKKITFYDIADGKLSFMFHPPVELTVAVLNRIMDITFLCANCLKNTKTPMTEMLSNPSDLEFRRILIEIDFGVPRFELPTSRLTYGSIFCLAHYLCKTLNQNTDSETPLNTPSPTLMSLATAEKELKTSNIAQLFQHCTSKYRTWTAFMVFVHAPEFPTDHLTSFLHYDISEFSACPPSITSKLRKDGIRNALEAVVSFLCGEVYFCTRFLADEHLFFYKREFCSEIQFFHEFVKKTCNDALAVSGAPTSRTSSFRSSSNKIMKYIESRRHNPDEIADNNFVVLLYHWLNVYCGLFFN